MLFPHIPIRTIDRVNHAIDSPSKKMVALQNSPFYRKDYDQFKLKKHGHRKYNHTMQSAILSAWMVDKKHAMELAVVHLMADKYSNYLHDRVGSSNKDVMESLINRQYDYFRYTIGSGKYGRKRKEKKMYYY